LSVSQGFYTFMFLQSFFMRKITILAFLIISSLLHSHLSNAQCHIDDWTALKALYESTDGDNWINNTNWHKIIYASDATDCNLSNVYGLHVNSNGRVIVIGLFNNQLKGNLPSEIGQLTSLKELLLSDNQLTEEIPSTIGNLSLLFKLDLRDNNFSGSIPAKVGDVSALTYLDLSNNGFIGLIPPQIGNLLWLGDMRLNNNLLNGDIPKELGNLINIESLDLSGNQLSGDIPAELGDLSKLAFLYLRNNQLRGEIPLALTKLSNLIVLFAYDNQLSGEIPSELNQLTKLEYLGFGVNQLSGEIPSSLGELNQLVHLSLDQNNLSGEIPKQLGNLNKLQQLWLWGNHLGGLIPGELGQLTELISLSLGINQLVGAIPKELGSLTNLNDLALRENQLSGCFDLNLNQLCNKIPASNISYDNNFDANWEDFCAVGAGVCVADEITTTVSTLYSGNVSISLNNNQNILKNNIATVYDYSTCADYTNISSCNPVMGFNNLAANEALWVVSKAAEYFSTYHNIQIPNINIVVNDTESPNGAKYKPSQHVIVLGAGDGVKRNAMTAPDIIGHEYAHAIIRSIKNLGNYKISGAFNESYADIFGELIEQFCYGYNYDWIYGSQVMINTAGNDLGLRNLAYPKDETMKYQLPNTYKGVHWIDIDNACFHIDNCGIHTNSGVHSYWFYLLANGGSGINDNGYSFNINGIGLAKARDIVFENLINYMSPQSTYNDVREGSIGLASNLYNNDPNILSTTIEAWNAVGVYEAMDNPIQFRITNSAQVGPEIIEDNRTVIPVEFDLSIDSLGTDMTADNLCFAMHLPDSYMELWIETIYHPLTANEITLHKTAGEVNICIKRLTSGAAKKGVIYPMIISNSSILRFKICIVSEDVSGEEAGIEPISISGYTKAVSGEEISIKPATLPFGFDNNDTDNGAPQNKLEISLQLNHKNCQTLGSVEIEVLNNNLMGVAPYNYKLKDITGNDADIVFTTNNTNYQFYNLEEGEYELEVKDSNNNITAVNSKRFSVELVAEQEGSICCAKNLVIPPGKVSGIFNTNSVISFSEGTLVAEGTFEICD